MIDAELFDYLEAQTEIRTELVDATGFKMFRDRIPHGRSRPALKYENVTANPRYVLTTESKCLEQNISLSVFAETAKQASDIAELIRLKLSGFQGVMGTTQIVGCTLDSAREFATPSPDASDVWEYQAQQDYRINYWRPLPGV